MGLSLLKGYGSDSFRDVVTMNEWVVVAYMVMKTVGQEEIVNSSIAVLEPTLWTGLGSWELVVVIFENVFGGIFNNELIGTTAMECTLDRSEAKMP